MEEDLPDDEVKYCPDCGFALPPLTTQCPRCARFGHAPVTREEPPADFPPVASPGAYPAAASARPRSRVGLLIVAIIMVAIAVAIPFVILNSPGYKARVAYREAVRGRARGAARVERALAGKEVFGAVDLELEPRADHAAGVEVQFAPDCAVPAPFRPAVREALAGAAQVGPRFGFPLEGATLHLVGGESRPRLDAEAAFVQAAVGALRNALEGASIELLEPLMAFSVETPAEFAGGILADLNARKADIERVESCGTLREIAGRVPLFHMFGYATAVRSLSQGRATFGMTPAGQRAVPEPELAARGLSWS